MNIEDENFQSKLPTFSDELIEQCKQSGDFRPILFEWYKFIGIFCVQISSISQDSPALRNIPSVQFAVLVGLLNRCSRLMLANTRLSSTGRYGETTRLLDRSISESAIKVQWLCHKDSLERFRRYLANGIKQDLMLKKQIEQNINNRDDNVLVIEERILTSIKKVLDLSELTEEEVNNAKPLQDFASMCNDLEYGDVLYTSVQRMGSHAVHGTWSELVFNYLEHENGKFHPRNHEISTQDAQFIIIIHLVIDALKAFLKYATSDVPDRREILNVLNEADNQIREIQHLAWEADFNTTS